MEDKEACGMMPAGEVEVIAAFTALMERLGKDSSEVRFHEETIRSEYRRGNEEKVTGLEARAGAIGRELKELQDSRRRGAISTPELLSRKNELSRERTDIQLELEKMADRRIQETEELLKAIGGAGGSFVFDEDTFLELVDTVLVHGQGHFTFHFRCGYGAEERSRACR